MDTKLYTPFENMSFEEDSCFLCGIKLTDDNKTEEHVIPKWLQNRYDLWNEKITLLNGTTLPYRMLKIPCCQSCNGTYLSKIENTIRKGVEGGYDVFRDIDKLTIFQWISKIFYGLLFKELSLDIDRRDKNKGTIITPELLDRFKMLHTFLQSVRLPIEFHDFKPWSIHIVEGIVSDNNEENFHYIDGFHFLTFSIKMGDILIIANLQDNGLHEENFNGYYQKLEGCKLNYVQFLELATKNQYSAFLLKHRPTYMIVVDRKENVNKIVSVSNNYTYDDWNNRMYAQAFYFYLSRIIFGVTFEQIYNEEKDLVWTSIFKEDGTFNKIAK